MEPLTRICIRATDKHICRLLTSDCHLLVFWILKTCRFLSLTILSLTRAGLPPLYMNLHFNLYFYHYQFGLTDYCTCWSCQDLRSRGLLLSRLYLTEEALARSCCVLWLCCGRRLAAVFYYVNKQCCVCTTRTMAYFQLQMVKAVGKVVALHPGVFRV